MSSPLGRAGPPPMLTTTAFFDRALFQVACVFYIKLFSCRLSCHQSEATNHFSVSQTIGTLLCNWPILVINFIRSGLRSSLFSHMEHMHCSSPSNKHLYTSKDIVKIKWSQPGPPGTLVLQFVPLWCQQNSQPSSRETDSEWEKAGRQAQTEGDGGIRER